MAGIFDNSIINQVQQANDIIDIVSEHVSLTKKGSEMVGLCPFHEDHKPSMYVSPVKQIFKCFACGAGGDVFKFVQMRENLTFPQAIERLAERAGIVLPKSSMVSTHGNKQSSDPNRLAKANAWAAEQFCKNLQNEQKGKFARDYLIKRKLTEQTIKQWQLGLAVDGDDLTKMAQKQKADLNLLAQSGLAYKKGASFVDKFTNRLIFPITDVTGRMIAFGGRTLDDNEAKYINSPTTALFDKSNCIYGLQHARKEIIQTETAIVVEGYMDCLMAHQFGFTNVVATMGTSFTNGQARILKRYAKNIVLLFDNDTAGEEAANRAIEICLSQHIDIKIAAIAGEKDPCDFLLTVGKEIFEQVIENAKDIFQFKWERLIETFGTKESLTDRKAAIEEFLKTIAAAIQSGNLSAIDRGLIVNRLSKIIALDAKQINHEINMRLARTTRNAGYNLKNSKVVSINLGDNLFAKAQQELLEVLLNEPKLFSIARGSVTVDTFNVPILRQTANILFGFLETGKEFSLTALLAETESVETANAIVRLAQTGKDKGNNFEDRLTGAINTIESCQKKLQRQNIESIKDKTNFLRKICDRTEKQNPRNLGMV